MLTNASKKRSSLLGPDGFLEAGGMAMRPAKVESAFGMFIDIREGAKTTGTSPSS
jgi:hypothetical protein